MHASGCCISGFYMYPGHAVCRGVDAMNDSTSLGTLGGTPNRDP